MSDWKREPLVHFLLIGTAVFALGALLRGPTQREPASWPRDGSDGGDRIVVTGGDIEFLKQAWARKWHRSPTKVELDSLIEDRIREEVLYRQALELGLHRDDTVVRRRLVQQMEYLSEDGNLPVDPTEGEVRAVFEASAEAYREPERRSYTHIYFDDASRADPWADATAVLARVTALSPPPDRAPELGDRFPMQYDYPRRSEAEVAQHMGPDFAAQLFRLAGGDWQGPLRSEYGVHLVRVDDVVESRSPMFEEVRERIREELLRQPRDRRNRDFYLELRSKYEITIEGVADEEEAD